MTRTHLSSFHTPVILSGTSAKRSEALAQSKDPYPRSSTPVASCEQHPVILSGAGVERSATPAQSKDLAFFSTVLAAVVLFLTVSASAQTLTGTVKNSTTGKPAAGDDVVLLKLGQGMEEAGRTKTDSKGSFSFKLDEQGPHLVRAIHQGVTYHRMAPPGTTSVEVEVFDVSKKLQGGLEVVADVMRLQAEQGQLEVQRIFAVDNKSKPPRTQMNDRNLEFYVPEGAKIVESSAMTQGGNPLTTAPVPVDDKKTRYAFLFPLRPGTTQFEVAYTVPYNGSANVDPKSIYPLQHFVAIYPKAMQFSATSGATYQPQNDPQQPDATVQVVSGTAEGQSLAFKISGEGTLSARQENAGAPSQQGGGSDQGDRPGGGLGPPIDAPDPLQKYRWWILAGFAAALVIGGIVVATRQQSAQRTARATAGLSQIEDAEDFEVPTPPRVSRPAAPKPQPPPVTKAEAPATQRTSSKLLDALKDELFDLEIEHKQGQITQQEYEKTKAALDQTLQRALRREAQKT